MWHDDPFVNRSSNIVCGILHSDKKYSKWNHLVNWVTEEEKESWLKLFNASVDEAKSWLAGASETDQHEFREEWRQEKIRPQQAFHPLTDTHSPVIWYRICRESFEFCADSDEDDGADDEIMPDS
jgi:hypothetical protein